MMGWRRLLQLLPNLHINETFETAQVIRKKWTLSLITPETESSVWTLWITQDCEAMWYSRAVITRGCSWFCTEFFGETLHCWTNCISISEAIHAGIESVRFPLESFFPRDAIELQLKTSVMHSWSELNFNIRKVLQNSKSARLLFRQCTS